MGQALTYRRVLLPQKQTSKQKLTEKKIIIEVGI